MEEKRSSGRAKRQPKVLDEGYWDCSVCTYKNSPEAYKCEMCDVRKGTSTRKPRINPQLVAQQVAQQFAPPPKKERSHTERRREKTEQSGSNKYKGPPRLKNVDRSKASHMAVTVGNVTVIVTDYQPKTEVRSSDSHISSDASDTNSSTAPHDLHTDSPAADTNNN